MGGKNTTSPLTVFIYRRMDGANGGQENQENLKIVIIIVIIIMNYYVLLKEESLVAVMEG